MTPALTLILSALSFIQFTAWRATDPCVTSDRYPVQGIEMHADIYECAADIPQDRPALLMLHGGGASLDSYYENIPELAKHSRIIAPDTRAHGRSSDEFGVPLSYELLADDLDALLTQLGEDKVHVLGWSDGGIIAKTFAMKYPERVEKLILVASIYSQDGYRPEAKERLLNATADNWEPDAKDLYEFVSPTPDYWPVLFEKARAMWTTAPNYTLDDLAKIQAPTLVMAATNDEYLPLSHSVEIADAIPGAELVLFEGADHMFPVTHAAEFNLIVFDELGW